MKKYFVRYNGFGNSYNLFHAEKPHELAAIPEGAEQITRKEAEKLCVTEKERRKNDSNFSGYADTMIYPVDYDGSAEDWQNQPQKFKVNGYIVERK